MAAVEGKYVLNGISSPSFSNNHQNTLRKGKVRLVQYFILTSPPKMSTL